MTMNQSDSPDQLFHYSRSPEYRFPFGAVAAGTSVELAIDVYLPYNEVRLCYSYGLYSFSYCETAMELLPGQPTRYKTCVRMPGEPGLFFYWFSVTVNDGQNDGTPAEASEVPSLKTRTAHDSSRIYYVMSRHKADGTGRVSTVPSRIGAHEDRYPAAFQITVFRKDFKTPDWFKGAVMYQIFPDRFRRGASYSQDRMKTARIAQERIYHEDWYEDVDIHGKPETGYLACDFFGGTLDGIAEKIPYLKDLHIDCLYLNPIFEARSNHRYDTADYMSPDPMLGGKEAFETFAAGMQESGISFILDGVFSHTGADSRYFNKLGRYPEAGAYQNAENGVSSKYSSWYSFFRDETGRLSYNSWWGFSDLPNVNENDLTYRDYIVGDEGVIKSWLGRGASGFRLDVSDELPDSFLRELRIAVKDKTNGEGVILGEVWEDASNKISYGSYRDFLLGNTHDSVMGYTFRDAVLGYISGASSAQDMNARLESYRENYPPEAYYCIMNLISSHDVPRAITVASGSPDPGDREKQKVLFLDGTAWGKGLALMRIALIIQMGYIGSPCIYYGDEIGMQGYRDPFNRRTYPWDRLEASQEEQLEFYREATGLRRKYPVLRTGAYRTLFAKNDVYIFERFLTPDSLDFFGDACAGPRRVVIAVNRSDSESFCFSLGMDKRGTFISLETEMGENAMEQSETQNALQTVILPPLQYQIRTFK